MVLLTDEIIRSSCSLFPMALARCTGKEFLLGRLIIPGASLSSQYELRGRRSYRLATEFSDKPLFTKLSTDFLIYRNVLEMVRIFLDASRTAATPGRSGSSKTAD